MIRGCQRHVRNCERARSRFPTAEPPLSRASVPSKPRLLGILGPGLITGASDDDPSGIATYSQAGAQVGFALLWLMPFTYPLMAVTQEISAQLGPIWVMVSPAISVGIIRHGWHRLYCAAALRQRDQSWSRLGSMGDVTQMLTGGPVGCTSSVLD